VSVSSVAMRVLASVASLILALGMRQKVVLPSDKKKSRGSDDASIQYIRIADHSTMAQNKPECNFYEAKHLAMKVPDSCCDPDAWPAGSGASSTPPDARTAPKDVGGAQYKCYVRERAAPNNGTYIRNFLGCWKGNIQANEGCAPVGTSMGNGYPMTEVEAKSGSENGDPESCNCETPSYVGQGCFVALTGYMKLGVPDPTANFLKISGTCPADSDAEETSHRHDRRHQHRHDHRHRDQPKKPSLSYLTLFGEENDQDDVAAQLAKVPQCDYQGLGNDTYRMVDESCCMKSTWEQAGVPEKQIAWAEWDKTNNGDDPRGYTCPVASLGLGGGFTGFDFVRGFQGCNGGQISASEKCVPDGIDMENGWPMAKDVAEGVWKHGDYGSCGCKEKLLIGDQCYVGATFPGMAFFGKSTGDAWCRKMARKSLPGAGTALHQEEQHISKKVGKGGSGGSGGGGHRRRR